MSPAVVDVVSVNSVPSSAACAEEDSAGSGVETPQTPQKLERTSARDSRQSLPNCTLSTELTDVLQLRRLQVERRGARVVSKARKEHAGQCHEPVKLTPEEKEELQMRRSATAERLTAEATIAERRASGTAELRKVLQRRRAIVSPNQATSPVPPPVVNRRRFCSPSLTLKRPVRERSIFKRVGPASQRSPAVEKSRLPPRVPPQPKDSTDNSTTA